MARINIEEEFWTDVRPLIRAMGDEDRAVGMAIRFLKFAQEKYKYGKFVTSADFKKMGFTEDLIPFFAEKIEGGYQAKGAEKHFGWLRSRVLAGAAGGKKSKPNAIENFHPKQKPKQKEANPNPLSSLLSPLKELEHSGGVAKPPPPDLNKKVWESYKNSWREKYGSDPIRNATVNSQISSLAKRLGPDSIEVVRFFLSLDDPFIKKQMHPIGLCLSNAEGIWGQWKTGRKTSFAPKKSGMRFADV